MSIRLPEVDVPLNVTCTDTHDPADTTVTPVTLERVDPQTLLVLEKLFPGHHGVMFLAGLLRQAVAKQLALPELEIHQVADVAVITAQSIRALAHLIGLSYDTTEKYVVVLTALRLLSKKRHRRQIVLHFPLCRCQLPEPEVLDHIQEMRPATQKPRYRPKVRSFANQVKRRFVLLRTGQLTVPSSVVATPVNQLQETLLEDIRHILQQEVDSETGSRLFLKIEGAVRSRCCESMSRLSPTTGDFEQEEEVVEGTLQVKESPISDKEGDSDRRTERQESRLSQRNGDSESASVKQVAHAYTKKSPSLQEKGDFENQVSAHESPLPDQKGDSDSRLAAQNGRLSASTHPAAAKTGDSHARVSDGIDNVNVILRNKIDLINVNVDEVATYLCFIFGEHLKKKGFYKNLRDTQNCRDVDTWLAAIIETAQAISRHRSDAISKPGGYFWRRCLALHREGVPPHLFQMVQRYGTLTYQQLLDTFQQGPDTRSSLSPPAHQSSSPRPKVATLTRTIERAPKHLHGMSPEAYTALVAHLKAEPQTKNMRYAAYRQDDGSILLLVEDWVGQQRWLWSLEEWRQCAQTIQRSLWSPEMKKSTSGKYHGEGKN